MPFTDKIKSSMKDVMPLHLKSVSDPGAYQVYSLDCMSSAEGAVESLLSCAVMGLLFYLENYDISTQVIESQSLSVPSVYPLLLEAPGNIFLRLYKGGAFLNDFHLMDLSEKKCTNCCLSQT